MHQAAVILCAFALASLAGCDARSTGVLDAGASIRTDAGSVAYTATFDGAAAGSLPVQVIFRYATNIGEPYPGASYAVYFYFLGLLSASVSDPSLSCTGTLPGNSLEEGSFSASDVGNLVCMLGTAPDGGVYPQHWQTVSLFELNVNAAGPTATTDVDAQERDWPSAVGSLTVTLSPLEPGVFPYPNGNVNLNVRFGP
jgi:hypothetical protein